MSAASLKHLVIRKHIPSLQIEVEKKNGFRISMIRKRQNSDTHLGLLALDSALFSVCFPPGGSCLILVLIFSCTLFMKTDDSLGVMRCWGRIRIMCDSHAGSLLSLSALVK